MVICTFYKNNVIINFDNGIIQERQIKQMGIRIIKNDINYKLSDVKNLLNQTYWAKDLSENLIQKSIEHSESFYLYLGDELIGFCRVITDFSTHYYVCDVVIDNKYRGKGYGRALMEAVVSDKDFGHVKGMLLNRDSHSFYEKFKFHTREEMYMQREKSLQ